MAVCQWVIVNGALHGAPQTHSGGGGWCLKLFVSTVGPSSHEFASQFGLAIFFIEKHPKCIAEPSRRASVLFNESAMAVTAVTVDRQR